jgi:AcrR family transcriptional regulator
VTPAAVGAAAGLSRPSVYQYFSSSAAILAAIIEDSFPRSNALLSEALEGSSGPLEVLETYVRETLRQAAEGAHRPAAALKAAQLPESCRSRLSELHHEQALPFMLALQQLDVPELVVTAQLLGGVIEAAMAAVESGSNLAVVSERTLDLVRAAL